MVDNVDQQGHIKGAILIRNRVTVERPNLDMRARADEHVDTLHRQIRTQRQQRSRNKAVPRTYVEHPSTFRDNRRQMLGKYPHTTGIHVRTVNSF